MLFNSFRYFVFLPTVFFTYWMVPHKFRWALLLFASYYFYMCWNPSLALLIAFTTAVHYVAAIVIDRADIIKSQRGKKRVLIASISISLGVLFCFKYFDFFIASFYALWSRIAVPTDPVLLNLLLPMGISFYTFQTLSYTVDVYRGKSRAEYHPGYLALYVSFFPQLVAGPIERSDRLLPQLRKPKQFNYQQAILGVRQIAVGCFKKMVVADTLAKGVNMVYDNPQGYSGLILAVASVMFALQIYGDFSGYSDIAIGSARLLGVDLIENFSAPYLARSIREFWSRWHISLSTWFRDYLYFPLGGNRVRPLRHKLNLLATFLLSGLWHGANWTFVIWGGIHGCAQILENSLRRRSGNADHQHTGFRSLPAIVATFGIVCFAWVFFRANTLSDAVYVLRHMFDGISDPATYVTSALVWLKTTRFGPMLLVGEIVTLVAIDWLQIKYNALSSIGELKAYLRWPIYIGFVMMIVLLSAKGTSAEFIYFQF